MISHLNLGGGRLGNQLFKLAFLYSQSTKHGYSFYLPRREEAIWQCFDLKWVPSQGSTSKTYEESSEFADGNHGDGVLYNGFFGSYRYIHPYREEFCQRLRFKNVIPELPTDRVSVSVHIRRGDFVLTESKDFWGDLYADGYYQKALAKLPPNSHLYLCSDDITWCKENSLGNGFDKTYVSYNDYDTLQLMTKTDINIIANSTFSFWGAYLNPKARVIAPFPYRGLAAKESLGDAYYYRDLILPEWEEISCFQGIS